MILNRQASEPPKPFEFLATFFGYFAVLKDIPEVCRLIQISKIIPQKLADFLLSLNSSVDFWYCIGFTMITFGFFFWFLPTKKNINVDQNSETLDGDDERIQKATQLLKRMRVIRIIRSLGFVWIREKILDYLNVSIYGTFKRPADWAKFENLKDFVDRVTFEDGTGIEYRYSKGYDDIYKRDHPADTSTYGRLERSNLTKKDIQVLLVASNYFVFWYVIYIMKKMFRNFTD